MHRCGVLVIVLLNCLAAAHGLPLPTTGCNDNTHCPSGYYCEVTQTYICQKCLQCEDFKREPPRVPIACVTSVTQCGSCYKSLVADRGRRDSQCVSLKTQKSDQTLLPYEWAVIVVALLIAILICAAAIYTMRHFYTFKILASTRTSVQPANNNYMLAPTAPQPPPPYNAVAISPPTEQEELRPFVKPISAASQNETRQNDGCQQARVFNEPTYSRTLPSSGYECYSPVLHEESLAVIREHSTDNNIDNVQSRPFEGQTTAVNVLPEDQTTPSELRDSNNNSDEGGDSSDSYNTFGQAPSFLVINVQNINALKQYNEIR